MSYGTKLHALRIAVILGALVGGACGDDDTTTTTTGETAGQGPGGQAAASGRSGSSAAAGRSGNSGSGGAGGNGSSAGSSGRGTDGADAGLGPDHDPQLPPADADSMESWLSAGYYKDWVCEDKPSEKKQGAAAIHAHGGANRVCSNIRLAASRAAGSGKFPKGVASVKELYDSAGKRVGTAVAVKIADDSDSGKGWYWWEGKRNSGTGLPGCAGCHGAAASDADHPGAGDYVYFQVRDEPRLPTIGDAAAVKAWLEAGHYKRWSCESAKTQKQDGAAAIHAHGANRVCSNGALSKGDRQAGQWPAGVASVKELYDGDNIMRIDVALKVAADSDEGRGWFWYNGTQSDYGVSACAGCHSASGSDADHPGAGDYVYFRQP